MPEMAAHEATWSSRIRIFTLWLLALVSAASIGGLLAAKPALADSTVTNTNDSGAGSLRQAILDANATAGADTISFNIPATDPNCNANTGVCTISPASLLPNVTETVTIDGYTQPGASENTLAKGDDADLRIRLDGVNTAGISFGLRITAGNSVVRGLSITRFPGEGIDIVGASADNNTIEGNFIGITPGGKDMGNGNGLSVRSGASGNTVGGTTPDKRNIISGTGPSSNLSSTGLTLSDTGTTSNKVMGNYIGTTKSGTGNLGNTGRGVFIGNGASNNLIGDNDLGDGLTNAANIIAYNGLWGVDVSGASSTGNSILRNSSFSNARTGINLGGVPNDPGDADTGPNNLQNYPLITSAKTGRRATTIKGTLESTPKGSFTIWFFKNPKSTKEEGKKFIGYENVTDTDGDGIMPFTFKPTKKVKAGLFVTALVTNDGGDTSEFSVPKKVRG
jgi:hypothetical protein